MEVRNCLYKESISSGLGTFELQIDSTGELMDIEAGNASVTIQSTSHRIIIKHVAAPTDWLPGGMKVDGAKAWLLYIAKQTDQKEMLTISFKLPVMSAATEAGSNTGEFLTAIEFEDGNRQVHIGTQDEEYYAWYGEQMRIPKRWKESLVNNELLINSIEANGLSSKVPELLPQEQFYLHYILAESPRCKAEEYPDEWDVSTWYVVDQSQKALEEAWFQQANKNGQ